MANINWQQAVGGDWSNAALWSTGLVPAAGDDVTIGLLGNYTVTLQGAAAAASLTLDAPGIAFVQSALGTLSLTGALTINHGRAVLDGVNDFGQGVTLNGGLLAVDGSAALGSELLSLSGGTLLTTADTLLTNALAIDGSVSLAAASGTTLEINSADGWAIAAGSTLEFGTAGEGEGTIVWNTAAAIVAGLDIVIRAGTLKAADDRLFHLTDFSAASVSIFASATLDANGFRTTLKNLSGDGTITNSGVDALLNLKGASFAGTIAGSLSLNAAAAAVTLTGASTYTGTTTIDGVTLTLGDGGTTGTIAATSAVNFTVNGGTFAIDRSDGYALDNAISGIGQLALNGGGTFTIDRLNLFSGGTTLTGGILEVGHSSALGSGALTLTGGKLLGIDDVALANRLNLSGDVTIAAQSGTTLDLLNVGGWTMVSGTNIDFGAAGENGTVIWRTDAASVISTGIDVHVRAGTLLAGDDRLYYLTDFSAGSTTVHAGATLDAGGLRLAVSHLKGDGTVTNSGADATFVLKGGDFAGSIGGALSLAVAVRDAILSGANSYTGTTTIDGRTLTLGDGGTTGSLAATSAIGFTAAGGTLAIDRGNSFALDNAISGTGVLAQRGSGTTIIDSANSYSGGTTISAGTLEIGHAAALGSGTVTMTGGTLLGAADIALANALALSGASTIAAKTGTIFTLAGGSAWSIAANTDLDFGAGGFNGTVVWNTPAASAIGGNVDVRVQAGTLKAGDASFDTLTGAATSVTIEAGARIDLAGFDATIDVLKGGGTLTSSAAGTQLTINGGSFAGTLDGSFAAHFANAVTLSGAVTIDQLAFTIGAGFTVTNDGLFDIVADGAGIAADPGGRLVNRGSFEKSAGAGAHAVAVSFQNSGFVEVEAGSLHFTGGFTNLGIVKGLLSKNGGTWTVTANAPGEDTFFGGSLDNYFVIDTAPVYVDGGVGNDTVALTASMVLKAGSLVNVETIEIGNGVSANLAALTLPNAIVLASLAAGSASVVGTQGADRITGGAGRDTMNGGGGVDRLIGGLGNDVYVLGADSDVVDETGGGIDTITSSITRSLVSYAGIENLTLLGTAASGTGNASNNTITGNNAANTLIGGGGADRLAGGAGNDLYVTDGRDTLVEAPNAGLDTVRSTANVVLSANIENLLLLGTAALGTGNASNNTITGNNAANMLIGAAGNDLLAGGLGNDTLKGGLGRDALNGGAGFDRFVFDTVLNRITNVDTITGFSVKDDTIMLDNAVMKGLGIKLGRLGATAFARNTTGLAADASDRIIYETDTGKLFYDASGIGGAAGIHFATLAPKLLMTNADFLVI